jgi:cytochrome c biogenesis protein CcdA/glutaredoxin
MKRWIFSLLLVISALTAPVFVHAQQLPDITYYYGIGCPHCAQVTPFLEDLQNQYPDLNIIKKEIYYDQQNAQDFLRALDHFNIPHDQGGIPFIIVGNQYLVGDTPIINNLEALLLSYNPTTATSTPQQQTTQLPSLIAISGAALVDAINPCAITVLIILLSTLLLAGEKRRALYGGLAFTAAIYISYFLFGLGIIYTLHIAGISLWFYRIVGVIAIVIGLANLKDFFWYGKGFVMEIPRRWRPTLQRILQRITSPIGAFLIGFVVTLFELPCTGGPYLFVLGLLSKDFSWGTAIPLLFYYNLIFVLPLLLITGLTYTGLASEEKVTEWKNKNLKILHLIAGIIMVALGFWVLL